FAPQVFGIEAVVENGKSGVHQVFGEVFRILPLRPGERNCHIETTGEFRVFTLFRGLRGMSRELLLKPSICFWNRNQSHAESFHQGMSMQKPFHSRRKLLGMIVEPAVGYLGITVKEFVI